jgi:hypothetical protein
MKTHSVSQSVFHPSPAGFTLRSILATVLLALPLVVQAGDLTLNDIKGQNPVQLSVDDLKQLMPNAKVVSYTPAGSSRYWKNEPNGKFIASSDVRRDPTTHAKAGSTAQGTWHVGDNGTYCVTLEWPKRSENWCRYIFKVGEKYYGVKTIADGTVTAYEFEFSK